MNTRLLLTVFVLSYLHPAFAQNSAPYWSLAGNSNASSASKLGTTNNNPLRFFSNNIEGLRIHPDGRVSLGTATARAKFTLFANGSTPGTSWILSGAPVFTSFAEGTGGNADHILAMASNTATARPNIIVRRARGTLASPTAVANNDYLSSLQASGYDGSNFQNPANIDFFVDGTPSAGNVPARISFSTGSSIENRSERLTIKSNGNVGVGTTSPAYKFQVTDNRPSSAVYAWNTFSGKQDGTAVFGYSVSSGGFGYGIRGTGGYIGLNGLGNGGDWTGPVYGVYATALGSAGTRYGIYAYSSGSGILNSFGVYGKAEGGTFNAAGYFSGNVWAANYYATSDRKFKADIKPLENALSGLMKLRPATYTFKINDYKGIRLPSEKQLGLIADEVKRVFPELVSAAVHPAEYKEGTREEVSPEIKYEGVNYQGLIPVLIASVQEQQTTIEALEKKVAEVEELKKQVAELKALFKTSNGHTVSYNPSYLEQNTPNPASGTTTIRYRVPETAVSARLILSNAQGQAVKTINLADKGVGHLSFNTSTFTSGTYQYSLWVDGKQADTKRLVIAR